MKFLTNSHLKRHSVVHSRLKEYQCSDCGKSYTQRNDLVVHLRKHHGPKVYKCEFCDEAFEKLNELKIHKIIHFDVQNSELLE